jgi:hypothetical protein
MTLDLVHPLKARPGDRIAVLSPSFAAAGAFPKVHEQAMRRLTEVTGLIPVEYPTTRQVAATAAARAADINAAFADPEIRAILAVVGGDDQITVIGHLDADVARQDPKPFLGTSDNTNLHHWLWANGIASFYGGSSQVHLGPGPGVDDIHVRSLRAALPCHLMLDTRPSKLVQRSAATVLDATQAGSSYETTTFSRETRTLPAQKGHRTSSCVRSWTNYRPCDTKPDVGNTLRIVLGGVVVIEDHPKNVVLGDISAGINVQPHRGRNPVDDFKRVRPVVVISAITLRIAEPVGKRVQGVRARPTCRHRAHNRLLVKRRTPSERSDDVRENLLVDTRSVFACRCRRVLSLLIAPRLNTSKSNESSQGRRDQSGARPNHTYRPPNRSGARDTTDDQQ